MTNALRYILQAITYVAFAIAVGFFSFWPRYQYASPDVAAIKLSLSHATDRVNPCLRLTPQEVASLAPNMRVAEKCERQRLPLTLELEVDGETMLRLEAAPSGVWGDGPASIYERFELQPGPHRIRARLRDTARSGGWDYTHTEEIVLEPGRYRTITFKAETGGFSIR